MTNPVDLSAENGLESMEMTKYKYTKLDSLATKKGWIYTTTIANNLPEVDSLENRILSLTQ